ncbi:MAG: ComF family protein [Bacteroidia bacterium]|nr:ComF family protein [Bacteroidia bacterium]
MAKKFWGKIKFEGAYAYLNFTRKGRVQSLMHRLKYKGEKDVGVLLGELMATEIMESPNYTGFDVIVPVPLHRKKFIKRGYNQSEYIANGLSNVLNIPVDAYLVKRTTHSSTQTKKKRFARWENVEKIFQLGNTDGYEGKHVLLVDDITTTGSTMSACGEQLLKISNSKVSVASLAFAN